MTDWNREHLVTDYSGRGVVFWYNGGDIYISLSADPVIGDIIATIEMPGGAAMLVEWLNDTIMLEEERKAANERERIERDQAPILGALRQAAAQMIRVEQDMTKDELERSATWLRAIGVSLGITDEQFDAIVEGERRKLTPAGGFVIADIASDE